MAAVGATATDERGGWTGHCDEVPALTLLAQGNAPFVCDKDRRLLAAAAAAADDEEEDPGESVNATDAGGSGGT